MELSSLGECQVAQPPDSMLALCHQTQREGAGHMFLFSDLNASELQGTGQLCKHALADCGGERREQTALHILAGRSLPKRSEGKPRIDVPVGALSQVVAHWNLVWPGGGRVVSRWLHLSQGRLELQLWPIFGLLKPVGGSLNAGTDNTLRSTGTKGTQDQAQHTQEELHLDMVREAGGGPGSRRGYRRLRHYAGLG